MFNSCSLSIDLIVFNSPCCLYSLYCICRLFLVWGCYEQLCCEHSYLCILVHMSSSFFKVYIWNRMLSSRVCESSVIINNVTLFSKVVILIYSLSSSTWEFPLLHILGRFGLVSHFNFSQSGGYIIVSHCGLNFPNY